MAKKGLSDNAIASFGVGVGAIGARLVLYYMEKPEVEPYLTGALVLGAMPGQHPFLTGIEWGVGAVGVDSLTQSEIIPMLEED